MSLLIALALSTALVAATPLDAYCRAPDPAFTWKLVNKFRSPLFAVTGYNILLTSQTWLTPQDSSIYTWRHWLQVSVPDNLHSNSSLAFLWLDGSPDNPLNIQNPPTVINPSTPNLVPLLSVSTNSIAAALLEIPNEPAHFPADYPVPNKRRTEDAIIAYTWRHYFNGSSSDWLLRMPMTNAAVKAMDALEQFTKTLNTPVNEFVVAGASKRGWTTWTTAAVDSRVKAMIPVVMPIGNMQPNINHQYRLYGGWSFALDDYIAEGVIGFLNLPPWKKLESIVDPLTYFSRYITMPKFVISATGDEFFPPDSPQWYWDLLKGEKLMSVVPDAEHSLASGLIDVGEAITAFYHLVQQNIPRPEYSWTMVKSNGTAVSGHQASISVTVGATSLPYLKSVQMWKATTLSTTQRDFRLIKCRQIGKGGCFNPVFWWPETLTSGNGVYTASVNAPVGGGWNGFLVELIFEYPAVNGPPFSLTVTSEINVVPDILPFEPCPSTECSCGAKCPPTPSPVAFQQQ